MLVQTVTSTSTTRISKVAINLKPVRKILKWLYKSSLLNLFLFVTQKVRLKNITPQI